jgi:hypothetical protein
MSGASLSLPLTGLSPPLPQVPEAALIEEETVGGGAEVGGGEGM